MAKPPQIHHFSILLLLCVYTILIISPAVIQCTKPHKPLLQSDVIEDVDATRLFRMIEEEDYLAVFFCEYSSTPVQTQPFKTSCLLLCLSADYT